MQEANLVSSFLHLNKTRHPNYPDYKKVALAGRKDHNARELKRREEY